jgi:uncharacterized membrane protein required for colicin V production
MVLNIIFNVLIIGILFLGIYFGFRRGLVRLAAKPVKVFAAIAITVSFCSSFGETAAKPVIDEPITGYVSEYLYENCEGLNEANVSKELPTVLKMAAGIAGVDVEEVARDAEDGGHAVIDAIADALADPVINLIAVALGAIILYFASKLLIALLFLIVDRFLKGGVVGAVNKFIGMLLGFLFSAIVVWALVAIVELVLHSPLCADNPYFSQFEGSFVYGFFKNYSPIELLMSF